MDEKEITTDVLVIGGAGAGLRAAIEARANGVDVVLASKMPAGGDQQHVAHCRMVHLFHTGQRG